MRRRHARQRAVRHRSALIIKNPVIVRAGTNDLNAVEAMAVNAVARPNRLVLRSIGDDDAGVIVRCGVVARAGEDDVVRERVVVGAAAGNQHVLESVIADDISS